VNVTQVHRVTLKNLGLPVIQASRDSSELCPSTNCRIFHSGTISISGVCKSATNTGDGVNIKILKNTDQVWPAADWQYVAADDTTGINIEQSMTVNAEDNIRFVVNQKGVDPSGDKTTWDPAISYDNNNLPSTTTFTRSSTAYQNGTQNGTELEPNTPLYETGKFGQALRIEKGTTNLLTANQSSAETDLTDWSKQNSTISKVSGGWIGASSVKCDLTPSGWNSWAGFTGLQLEPGMYTFSVYAKGTTGKKIDLFFQKDGSEATGGSYTLASTWQRYSFPCNVS